MVDATYNLGYALGISKEAVDPGGIVQGIGNAWKGLSPTTQRTIIGGGVGLLGGGLLGGGLMGGKRGIGAGLLGAAIGAGAGRYMPQIRSGLGLGPVGRGTGALPGSPPLTSTFGTQLAQGPLTAETRNLNLGQDTTIQGIDWDRWATLDPAAQAAELVKWKPPTQPLDTAIAQTEYLNMMPQAAQAAIGVNQGGDQVHPKLTAFLGELSKIKPLSMQQRLDTKIQDITPEQMQQKVQEGTRNMLDGYKQSIAMTSGTNSGVEASRNATDDKDRLLMNVHNNSTFRGPASEYANDATLDGRVPTSAQHQIIQHVAGGVAEKVSDELVAKIRAESRAAYDAYKLDPSPENKAALESYYRPELINKIEHYDPGDGSTYSDAPRTMRAAYYKLGPSGMKRNRTAIRHGNTVMKWSERHKALVVDNPFYGQAVLGGVTERFNDKIKPEIGEFMGVYKSKRSRFGGERGEVFHGFQYANGRWWEAELYANGAITTHDPRLNKVLPAARSTWQKWKSWFGTDKSWEQLSKPRAGLPRSPWAGTTGQSERYLRGKFPGQ